MTFNRDSFQKLIEDYPEELIRTKGYEKAEIEKLLYDCVEKVS